MITTTFAIHSLSGELSRLVLSLTVLLAVCCGSTSQKSTREKTLFDAKTQKANKLAPDLVARALNAHEQALQAEKRGENFAAKEYSTCARLLLEAAQIEAERVEIERQRKREQERVDRANVVRIRHLRARQEVEREVALVQVAQKTKLLDSPDFHQTGKKQGEHTPLAASNSRAIQWTGSRASKPLSSERGRDGC